MRYSNAMKNKSILIYAAMMTACLYRAAEEGAPEDANPPVEEVKLAPETITEISEKPAEVKSMSTIPTVYLLQGSNGEAILQFILPDGSIVFVKLDKGVSLKNGIHINNISPQIMSLSELKAAAGSKSNLVLESDGQTLVKAISQESPVGRSDSIQRPETFPKEGLYVSSDGKGYAMIIGGKMAKYDLPIKLMFRPEEPAPAKPATPGPIMSRAREAAARVTSNVSNWTPRVPALPRVQISWRDQSKPNS